MLPSNSHHWAAPERPPFPQAMRTHAAHAAHAFLQFDAQPLLAGMIDELASWKALFTERLRVQGSDALQVRGGLIWGDGVFVLQGLKLSWTLPVPTGSPAQALSKRLAGLLLDLERPVEDLEDYRHLSACLSIVHDMEFSFGDDVEPIEYTYALLGRLGGGGAVRCSWCTIPTVIRACSRKENTLVWQQPTATVTFDKSPAAGWRPRSPSRSWTR